MRSVSIPEIISICLSELNARNISDDVKKSPRGVILNPIISGSLFTHPCFHSHAIKNKLNANHSIQKVQNLGNERK